MGEIAEMMLDGTMCQQCGEFMGDAGDGYPMTCAVCSDDDAKPGARWNDGPHITSNWHAKKQASVPAHVKCICPQCGKRVKAAGFYQHMQDVHQT